MSSNKVDIKISVNGQQAANDVNKITKSIGDLGNESKSLGQKLQNATNLLFSGHLISIAVSNIKNFASSIAGVSDSFNLMQARLKLVTKSEEEFAKAQQDVLDIARDTRSDIDGVSNLYIKLSRSLKSAGDATTNVADITRTITQAMKVSGATTAETQATLLQLGQALASGTLRGEEFNSISEQGSRVSQALADSLGVTIGQLREMAQQGKLATDVVVGALKKQADVIGQEFAALPLTISDSVQLVNNSWAEFIGMMDDASGTSENVANGIKLIADNISTLISGLVIAGKVWLVAFGASALTAMRKMSVEMVAQYNTRREAIKLLKTQAQEQRELAAAEAQRRARGAQFAAQESQEAVARQHAAVIDQRNSIARLKLMEQELALLSTRHARRVADLRIQLQAQTSEAGFARVKAQLALAEGRLSAIETRRRQTQASLQSGATALAASEERLTAAIQIQNNALINNSAAQKKAASAAALAAGQIAAAAGVMTRAGVALKSVGGFLLGLPGLLLYAAYEVTAAFANIDAVIVSLSSGFQKLAAYANPANWFDSAALQARLDEIDKSTSEAFDRIIEDEQKKKAAYKDTAKTQQELVKSTAETEKAALTELQSNVDREVALHKVALATQYTDKAEYEARVQELETQSSALKTQAQLDYSNAQLGAIQQYYDQRAALKTASDISLDQANELLSAREIAGFSESISRHLRYNDQLIAAEQRKNVAIAGLSTQQAQALKTVSQHTLDALIGHTQRLANEQRQAIASNKAILQDYNRFVREINGDQRSGYQKLADAQKTQREIEEKLLNASRLQQEGNHKAAQVIAQEAYGASKTLAQTYKEISDEAGKGSLTQVQASGKVKDALELVKSAMDGVTQSNDAIIKSSEDGLKTTTEQIGHYKNIIAELDTQLDKTRTVKIGVDVNQTRQAIADIDAQIKALNQTVTITTKRVEAAGSADVKKANGGFIPRKNKVPGTGSGDKIKALLEPGEFIVRKSAVDKYGADYLYALNNEQEPVKRADGGLIYDPERNDSAAFFAQLAADWEKRKNNPGGVNGQSKINARNDAVSALSIIDKLKNKFSNGIDDASVKPVIDLFYWLNKKYEDSRRGLTGSAAFTSSGKLAKQIKSLTDGIGLFNDGGSVPGTGSSDRVKALLTPGEFVVKKSVVQQLGTDFFERVNAGVLPQRFNQGGIVGSSRPGTTGETINVNLSLNGQQSVGTFDKNDATMALINELKRHGAA